MQYLAVCRRAVMLVDGLHHVLRTITLHVEKMVAPDNVADGFFYICLVFKILILNVEECPPLDFPDMNRMLHFAEVFLYQATVFFKFLVHFFS